MMGFSVGLNYPRISLLAFKWSVLFISVIFTPDLSPRGHVLPADFNYTFPANCTSTETEFKCNELVPYSVPDSVTVLILSRLKTKEFYPARFCNVSWNNVKELIIESVKTMPFEHFQLVSWVFDCLGHIETFRFSSKLLLGFAEHTFSGLTNLKTFDLAGCRMVSWEDVKKTFSIPTNFPNLTHLILSETGSHQLLDLDQQFINYLSFRPIVYLDFSYTLLNWDFSAPGNLCETLSFLKYEGAQVLHSKVFKKSQVCNSLRTVDDSSDAFFRSAFQNITCKNEIVHFLSVSPFFWNTQVLFMNDIITASSMYTMSNCLWVLWPKMMLKEMHFAHNFLPHFDVKMYNNRLEIINLSNNKIESINSEVIRYLSSLRSIDLSNNNLSQSGTMPNTFSTLFSKNEKLKDIDLSGNGLTFLPDNTFSANTNLKRLALSHNSFSQITFSVSQLTNLSVLDLRFNSVTSFDKASRKSLDALYERQSHGKGRLNESNIVQVLLDGNPLSCSCESLLFVQWFVPSPLFSATIHQYHCLSNGHYVTMGEAAIGAAKEDCARIERRRLLVILLSTLVPAVVLAVFLVILHFKRKRKKRLMNQRLQDGIRRIRCNNSRFPVFLSYSSDDSDFVKRHLLRKFEDQLRSTTGLDREMVCIADVHFHPARTILSEIYRCLKQCDVFVAVMSNKFCKSHFCRYEIEHAHFLKKPIILIFTEYVDKHDMDPVTREIFEKFTRVQFVMEDDDCKMQPGWRELCESIIQLL